MESIMKKIIGFILMSCMLSLLISCRTSENEKNISISGKLAYNTERGISRALGDALPDQIWAVPVTNDFSSIEADFNEKEVFTVNNDGSFDLTFNAADADYSRRERVFLLINSQAVEKKDMILGYLGMKDVADSSSSKIGLGGLGGIEVLLGMPIGAINKDINMGDVIASENEAGVAQSSTTLDDNADNFSLSVSDLKRMARTDNLLKQVRNAFVNDDDEYSTVFRYAWVNNGHFSDINNVSYGPENFMAYNSYQFEFHVPSSEFDFNAVANQTEVIELYPPTEIHAQYSEVSYNNLSAIDATFGPTVPITSEDGEYFAWWLDMVPYENYGYYNQMFSMSKVDWSGDPDYRLIMYQHPSEADPVEGTYEFLKGVVPEGPWVLKKRNNSREFANYDFSLMNPLDATGTPTIYVPSVRVIRENNKLKTFYLTFYLANSDGSYEQISSEMLQTLTDDFWILIEFRQYIEGASGDGYETFLEKYEGNCESYIEGNEIVMQKSDFAYQDDYTEVNYLQVELYYEYMGVTMRYNMYFFPDFIQ